MSLTALQEQRGRLVTQAREALIGFAGPYSAQYYEYQAPRATTLELTLANSDTVARLNLPDSADPANRVLVRKAIDPADFLAAATVEAGLRPRSERPIRLALETDEVQPAGYSVSLFYR